MLRKLEKQLKSDAERRQQQLQQHNGLWQQLMASGNRAGASQVHGQVQAIGAQLQAESGALKRKAS